LVLDTRALAAAKLGCINLIFVEPGAKINVADAEAATAICSIAGDVFAWINVTSGAIERHSYTKPDFINSTQLNSTSIYGRRC